jgi:radical SAM superfamily enzyme YgiQ (UPF0313 family)
MDKVERRPYEGDKRIEYVLKTGIGLNYFHPDVDMAQARAYLKLVRTNGRARLKYLPHVYRGSVTLFRPFTQLVLPPSDWTDRSERIGNTEGVFMSFKRELKHYGPNLLCIVPPYPVTVPPAGAASLLGYLKATDCGEVDFLDLRLWAPQAYSVTYSPLGVFGESYVIDIPDLPLVLWLINAFERGEEFLGQEHELLTRYCLERGINPDYLVSYLRHLQNFLDSTLGQIPHLEFVGFTVWNSNYLSTLMAAVHLKKRKSLAPFIVAGGPQVTESPNAARLALRSSLFDAVVLGEGEETFRSLYEEYRASKKSLSSRVPGTLTYDSDSKQFVSIPRQLLKLPALPVPSFENMHLQAYQAGNRHLRILPLQLSRGCTDKCSFCSEWVFWERYRVDSVDHVLGQVEELHKLYRIDGIAFTDSLLNGVMDRLRAFAEGLLRRNIRLRWGGFMRAQMDYETARLLKRAGCVLAFIGIESFSDKTLALMNKRRTNADNVNALRAFLSAGISIRAGFIPGFPGDTRSRFLETAKAFYDLQREYSGLLALGIEPFVVSPGQPIYKNIQSYGLELKGWDSEYLDISPKYGDITEMISCTVEGANQGMERLGQYQIAITMSQESSNRLRTQVRSSSIQDSDFMYYSYDPQERESSLDIDFEHISANWCLGSFKTETGIIYSCLVTPEEKELFVQARRNEQIVRPWSTSKGLLEKQAVKEFLDQIESQHAIPPRRSNPLLFSIKFKLGIDSQDLLAASPFTIVRLHRKDGGDSAVVAHTRTKQIFITSNLMESLLSLLKDGPISVRALLDEAQNLDETVSGEEIYKDLDKLVEYGMLCVCEPAKQATAF